MDKLFHVFISSTYSDLREERGRVSEALSKAGQVSEGMEIFPASSQKQLDFIKRVIDRCDYYVLILGARYGSTIEDGTSFTELEYEYAVKKQLPTLAFLHSDPTKVDPSKIESDPEKARRLLAFRKRVQQSNLVDYWNAPDQLATKVVAAIAQEVSSNPGIGWIRGNRAASDQLLNEINDLRKSNEELRTALRAATPDVSVSDLARLDEIFEIRYEYRTVYNGPNQPSKLELSWREILRIVGPHFRTPSNTSKVETVLERHLKETRRVHYYHLTFSMSDKERILNQLELLGYMKSAIYNLNNGGQAVFYALTPRGVSEVLRLNAVVTGTPQI